jgi:predicted Zn-dependent peptidase
MMGLGISGSLRHSELPLGFPAPEQFQLSNGCPITCVPMADAPVVCLEFWCKAGSAMEESGESGIAHFLEHMVFKGNEQLPPGAFDLQIESMGGSSNAATGFDEVHYHLLIPPDGFYLACSLLPQLILQPGLEPESFQMERLVVLEELSQSEDQPEEVAFQQLLQLACGNHPYGRPILGLRSDLKSHNPSRMRDFQQRHYNAANCAVAIGGCFNPAEAIEILQAGPVGLLESNQLINSNPKKYDLSLNWQPGEHQISLARLESARMLFAWQAPAAADPQALIGIELWATALAEGRTSRFVQHLRENLQLVESIDLDIHPLELGSLVLMEVVCDPANLSRLRWELDKLLEQLSNGLSEQELDRAKRLVGNGYTFSHESISQVTSYHGQASLHHRLQPLDIPLKWLDQWDLESLNSMAEQWDIKSACLLEVLPK